jgi:hypothetical protein
MNIDLKGGNKQKYLVFVLIIAVLGILFVFNKDALLKKDQGEGSIFLLFEPQKIEINFDLLSNAILRDLRMPQDGSVVSTSTETVIPGQQNPFISSK